MKKDVKLKPGISVIDEVPIIPTHAMLEDRDLPEQHPIDAIEGLTDALAGISETEQTLREDVDDLTDVIEEPGGLSDRMETAEDNISANTGAIQDLDSSAVHKSGAETITGAKTFSGAVEASGGLAVRNATAPSIGLFKGSAEAGSVGASGTQIGISAGGAFLGIKDTAGTPYAVAPTAEGVTDADAIVTRSGLASDTRVVHTTGTETIAGSKSFSSAVNSNEGFRWYYAMPALTTSNWIKLYTFEPPTGTTALRVLIEAIDSGGMLATMFDVIEVVVHTSMTLGGSIRSNSNIIAKLALNTAGKIELWLHKTTGSGTTYLYCNFLAMRGLRGVTVDNASGTEPTEGADYTSVITLEAVE